jgi:hypothetical protein
VAARAIDLAIANDEIPSKAIRKAHDEFLANG